MRLPTAIQEDTGALREDMKEFHEQIANAVVKKLEIPLANQTADIMDNNTEQADRMIRTFVIMLDVRFGKVSESAAAQKPANIDREFAHNSKMLKAANKAAAKAAAKPRAKAKSKCTAKRKAKRKAKSSSNGSNSTSSSSRGSGNDDSSDSD